ncbi:MAG TPA: methylmalonyl-CoA epimerase [Solirubrobacterales bacterium]|jgi:methylmalonyl-CoA epimerase|nr:methylmalonyl-CoA epimerase [Solirubrobacterales bacterium]HMU26798.1 methylmalonyl-CoA epimerase [Solirubrobacterales bacterium]HMX70188.1 methylmalonyl-CoA epimerase [Solirubrobacterales bacterium]HMY26679.1 methylmalonyl-CoA epimerase [Solirubrobacterales bacterium]HNA24948.1 methylmalonyl-CoA epimerase [Solirubrobacterales bacterium]
MFTRIDHIGVAVEDLDAAIKLYERNFEMELVHRETVESQGVEAVLLDVGDGHVELLSALGPDTPVGKYIAKKGPGLHHVAYAVEDIDATLASLKEQGVKLIDQEARTGIRQSRVAFLHPAATGSVLTEIVQPAEDH